METSFSLKISHVPLLVPRLSAFSYVRMVVARGRQCHAGCPGDSDLVMKCKWAGCSYLSAPKFRENGRRLRAGVMSRLCAWKTEC